ncbi:endonuclease/exonuclease/phosphatase family protein [Salinisphaera orenii]|uniref:endonuclease/exonuclease/phosphatase family protein n=1 Tax=Salinisphaera orenii TaxID=856731 RepID=UPI000DBE3431
MTYNVQVGAGTAQARHYVSRGWRQLAPNRASHANIRHIARLLGEHDIVGLQEIDAGSWRTSEHNQVQRLAQLAGFEHWYTRINRNFGRFAQHGLGLLSRFEPSQVSEHTLPGRIPGRGALIARFENGDTTLAIAVAHLALGAKSCRTQLDALIELMAGADHGVILADTNCSGRVLTANPALRRHGMQTNAPSLASYPSWRPRRDLDHIICTPNLATRSARVLDVRLSDHRPVCQMIGCPAEAFADDMITEATYAQS